MMLPGGPIRIQSLGDITLVEFCTPSLMDAMELEAIEGQLRQLVDEQDRRRLVLDFEQVQYLSSRAIGCIIMVHNRLSKLPRSALVLCGMGEKLRELLRITQLDSILTLKPTQKEAVRSLS